MIPSTAQGSRPKAQGLFPLVLLAWFSLMTPWGTFPDPDAFYHAHIAKLMLDRGPLHAFPWLDLTTLGTQFADHHFLFHLILGPAVAAFGEFWGTQLMAPLLATATALALWNMLRRMEVPAAWLFVALALLSPTFTERMLLAKASPLAVGLTVVIIGAYLFRKPFLMFAAALLYALSHGGWILAFPIIGLMLIGDICIDRVIDGTSWRSSVKELPWRTALALPFGIAAGLLLHPNRAEIWHFLWVQVVEVSIFSTGAVLNQGLEWHPSTIGEIIQNVAPLAIAGLVILAGLLFAGGWRLGARGLGREAGVMDLGSRGSGMENGGKDPTHDERRTTNETRIPLPARRAILLAFPVALTLAMTLNSRRHYEYLVPAIALWFGSLAALVDWAAFNAWLRTLATSRHTAWGMRVLPLALSVLLVHHASAAWRSLHGDHYRFDAYRNTLAAISERAEPGDRVFHSNWDEFPMLWAADDRLKYLFGLDPTFLYAKDPELSKAQFALVTGQASSTLWELIVDRTRSRFVFVTTERLPNFDTLLKEDPRFKELARDDISASFEIVHDEKSGKSAE